MVNKPRRRLLILSPFAPRLDAPHGGGRAIAQLVDNLSSRHDVALLCLRATDEPSADPRLYAKCQHVEEMVRLPIGRTLSQRARLLAGIARGRPMWATDWSVPQFGQRLRVLARTWRPDIVQIEFHIMAQYLHALADCPAPRVLTVHEPGAAAMAEQCRSLNGWARRLCLLDLIAWKRFERFTARNVHALVTFTERDQRAMARTASSAMVHTIPLGTSIPARPLNPPGDTSPTLLFVGGFGHPPNAEAARRLATQIFPRIRARRPDVTLYLVGRDPPEELCAIAGAGVQATGYVEDVTPYLERASVVVIPIRYGGGMRVKVLEALAAGKAVVASPLAIEGLDLTIGRELLIADSDEELIQAVLSLLDNTELRMTLGIRARAWAGENLGWEGPIHSYEAIYEQLLAVSHRF